MNRTVCISYTQFPTFQKEQKGTASRTTFSVYVNFSKNDSFLKESTIIWPLFSVASRNNTINFYIVKFFLKVFAKIVQNLIPSKFFRIKVEVKRYFFRNIDINQAKRGGLQSPIRLLFFVQVRRHHIILYKRSENISY